MHEIGVLLKRAAVEELNRPTKISAIPIADAPKFRGSICSGMRSVCLRKNRRANVRTVALAFFVAKGEIGACRMDPLT